VLYSIAWIKRDEEMLAEPIEQEVSESSDGMLYAFAPIIDT
jgi:hypothetical protein